MKNIYKTYSLTSAQRAFVVRTLNIPASQLDLRRRGVTIEWVRKVFNLACIVDRHGLDATDAYQLL